MCTGTAYFLNAPVLVQLLVGVYSVIAAEQVGVFYFSTGASSVSFTFQLAIFVLIAIAGWVQIWATINALPHRRALCGLPHSGENAYNPSRFVYVLRKAWNGRLANALFIVVPLAILGSVLPLAVRAGEAHTALIKNWVRIDNLLANANQTQSWSDTSLEAVEQFAILMNTQQDTLEARMKDVAGVYTAWVLAGALLYAPFAWATIKLLGRQISFMKSSINNNQPLHQVNSTVSTVAPSIHLSMSPNPFDDHHFAINTSDQDAHSLSPNHNRSSTVFATSSPYLDSNSPDLHDPFSDMSRVPTSHSDAPPVPPKHDALVAQEYNDERAAKLVKLVSARRIALTHAVCSAVTFACYIVLALSELAGGLSNSLGYHNYLVWLLWFPALGFLVPALVTTAVFVFRSRARQPLALDEHNMTVRKFGRSPYELSSPVPPEQPEQVVEIGSGAFTLGDEAQPPVSPRPDVPRSIHQSERESTGGLSISFVEESEEDAVVGRAQRVVVSPTPPQLEARASEEVRISFDGDSAAWGEEVRL